jgi:protein-S-isoprenylcysteine O-methyltransferase Ste14
MGAYCICFVCVRRSAYEFRGYARNPFHFLGVIAISAGVVLHSWTAKLLGIKATVGLTEIKPEVQFENQKLVTSGPFSVVRHPSYWAHTLVITGFYLITGVIAMGIIAVIDLGITYFDN